MMSFGRKGFLSVFCQLACDMTGWLYAGHANGGTLMLMCLSIALLAVDQGSTVSQPSPCRRFTFFLSPNSDFHLSVSDQWVNRSWNS
uniref:Uncharacterized protein n=1 Tax=Paramormyrops kingsleyae TaxID=1676925 RepID=A0A3B3QQU7_9TELE